MGATVVDVAGLTARYGRDAALDDVTFTAEAGTLTALVGPNGAGKTTLLHVLAGLHPVAAGRVTRKPGWDTTAYVLQRHDHHEWMPLTVAEVLRMGRYGRRGLLGRLDRADRTAVATAAERLEVADLGRRQFHELSAGQQQRVLFAQALAAEAPVLLLDEPVTGLDLASQQRIFAVVADERAAGRVVLYSTHHLDEANHADQVLLLARRLVAAGPPRTVLTGAVLRRAYGDRVLDVPGEDAATLIDDHAHGTERP